jgi:DNA-binding winged helix-turn-helix (wHTH) protein/Tol biopolymer transport system component
MPVLVHFGPFELDLSTADLHRNGRRIRLPEQQFQILEMLLRGQGELVSRDEIRKRLWSNDTVVEFDRSINAAIKKLRAALEDSADAPRFIETVASRGYRIMVEVQFPEALQPVNAVRTDADVKAVPGISDPPVHSATRPEKRSYISRWSWISFSVAGIAAVVAIAFLLRSYLKEGPTISGVTQLTDDGNPKLNDYNNSGEVSDGSRIYFNEMQGGRMVIAQVAATGGQTGLIDTTVPDSEVHALASDSSNLLIVSSDPSCCHLWTLPLPAGGPRKLLEVLDLMGADLSPDGHIFYTRPNSLYVADSAGSNPRRLFEFPGPASYPAVSPDGKKIRVKVGSSLWEVNSDGSGAHPLTDWPGTPGTCCGRWTSDGRYFVYQSRERGRTDLWALPERSYWFGRSRSPVRLTNGPLSYVLPFPSPDGKHIYAIGLKERGELVRYDRHSQQFVPYLSGISAMDATVSRDGSWVTYMSYPNRNLWRSRADGNEPRQLTFPPVAVMYPRISPDGTKVAYGAVDEGGIECAYVLPLAGGTPRKVAEHATSASWSPDGNSLLIGPDDDFTVGLRTVDLQSGKIDSVPGSAGRGAPIWASNDMFVALEPEAGERLVAFNIKTQTWSDLMKGPLVHWMQSVDGSYLYYTTGGDDPKMMRLRFVDHKVEEIASLKSFRPAEDEDFGSWLGVSADGSPLLTRDIGTQEIYDLSVRW